MIIKRKRVLIPSIVSGLLAISIIVALWERQEILKSNQTVIEQSKKITDMNKREVCRWQKAKQQIEKEKTEKYIVQKIADERGQKVIDLLVANEFVWIFQQAGTIHKNPWITEEYVYNRIQNARRWKHLTGLKESSSLDLERVILCWSMVECCLCPNLKQDTLNKDCSVDWGFMQMNTCNLRLLEKGERWDNPEHNIKVWCNWIREGNSIVPRHKDKFWYYYWKIGRIKDRFMEVK